MKQTAKNKYLKFIFVFIAFAINSLAAQNKNVIKAQKAYIEKDWSKFSDLLKKENGWFIDNHDIIIRFNSFLIDEKYTGIDTTMHVAFELMDSCYEYYVPIRFITSTTVNFSTLNRYNQSYVLRYDYRCYDNVFTKFEMKIVEPTPVSYETYTEPVVIQQQPQSLGKTVTDGIASGIGWGLGTSVVRSIFGSPSSTTTNNTTYNKILTEYINELSTRN